MMPNAKPVLFALLFAAALTAAAERRITRVFCWGFPADDAAAARYAAAGATDIQVRDAREAALAKKYGMTPYFSCFTPAGPHRQQMAPEEEAHSRYINGLDLDPKLPKRERMKIVHARRIEKQHRYGGDSVAEIDTLRCDLPCFVSDDGLALTKKKLDDLVSRAPEGVAGIYLDYIGYTNHRGCYCPECLGKLRRFLAERGLADTPENRAAFYREKLVGYCNAVIDHVKLRRPDFKVVIHIYPEFRPDPLYGNRVKADFCGQTVAWYFKWDDEKIDRCTRFVVGHAHDFHPDAVGIPFLGVNRKPGGSLAVKTPETVAHELDLITAAGGRVLMVCDGSAMIAPGYFEVFRRYCGKEQPRAASCGSGPQRW
jgi:hypothetical protein